jgi:hypothetical protein
MKKYLLLFAGVAASALIAACGKSNSSNKNTGVVCPVGYYIASDGLCYQTGSNIPYNNTLTTTYADFNNNYGSYYRVTGGSLTIRNAAAYREFLKNAMGVCDRTNFNGGSASCDSWIGGGLAIAIAPQSATTSNQTIVKFEAIPTQSYWSGYFGIDNGSAWLNPLTLTGTTSVINNYAGFQIDAYGNFYTPANIRQISIMVRNGKLTDNFFTYEVYFPLNNVQTLMASGTMRRH